MKKIIITLVTVVFATAAYAQVDSAAMQRQQEELLKKQMKEQQELLERQQKEQEAAAKQLQKDQEAAAKQLQKEQEAAVKQQQKDQEAALKQQQKDQERELKEQQKEQEKAQKELLKEQEKKMRREQRREEIGRGDRFSINPYAGYGQLMSVEAASPYNANIVNLGFEVEYHYPLTKKLDVSAGLGYRCTMNNFVNDSYYDTENGVMTLYTTPLDNPALNNRPVTMVHSLMLPIRLSFVGKEKGQLYLGINPGLNFTNKFSFMHLTPNNDYLEVSGLTAKNIECMTGARLDVMVGLRESPFILLNPGLQLYFNLLPVYNVAGEKYHEFGIIIEL